MIFKKIYRYFILKTKNKIKGGEEGIAYIVDGYQLNDLLFIIKKI